MAEQSKGAEKVAKAVIESLGDANHPIWRAGTPGLSRNAWDRFPAPLRAEIMDRLTAAIEDAL